MIEFFVKIFSENIWFAVFLISMVPGLEARIAIPFGLSISMLGSNILNPFLACLCGFIGSIIPCLPIIFIIKKIRKSNKILFFKISNKKNIQKLNLLKNQKTDFKKCLYLASFVAIPLPLTGVWMGSVIAGFIELNIWKSFVAILSGAALSSLIICVICLFFGNQIIYFLVFSIIIIFAVFLINIVKSK